VSARLPPVSRPEIEHAVERIVRLFAPSAVILFGSYAYGEPTPDSDVDLLVTMETPLRPVDQAVEIRTAVQFPFPLDLIVRTPAQVSERISLGDPFFQEILEKGIVLYEATDGGMDRQGGERLVRGRNPLDKREPGAIP
jgi:predicted nucleotidyltransferase